MTAPPVERTQRHVALRAPITGLVLVVLVVFGTYWGWQKAFGESEAPVTSADGCETSATTTTTGTTTGAATTGGTTAAVPPVTPPATTPPAVPPATAPVTTGPTTVSSLVLQPGDVSVNVYNATLTRGLANNTAALLRDRGFVIESVQNDPLEATVLEAAQIRAARSDMPEVRLLIQHVPGAVVVPDGRSTQVVDLVLGEAFTALGDPALVTPVPIATPRC